MRFYFSPHLPNGDDVIVPDNNTSTHMSSIVDININVLISSPMTHMSGGNQ